MAKHQGFGINFYKVYNYWFHFTRIWEFYGPRKVEILFLFFRCENFAKKYFRADMFKIEMLTHASSLMQLWLNKEKWIKFQTAKLFSFIQKFINPEHWRHLQLFQNTKKKTQKYLFLFLNFYSMKRYRRPELEKSSSSESDPDEPLYVPLKERRKAKLQNLKIKFSTSIKFFLRL